MSGTVTLSRRDGIAVIQIDHPPVNALSPDVIAGLETAITEFENDRSLKALVVACAGRTFVAGGDITHFDDPDFETRTYNGTLARIEAMDRPVVAGLPRAGPGRGAGPAFGCPPRRGTPGPPRRASP